MIVQISGGRYLFQGRQGTVGRSGASSITMDLYRHWIPGEGKMDLTRTLRDQKPARDGPVAEQSNDNFSVGADLRVRPETGTPAGAPLPFFRFATAPRY